MHDLACLVVHLHLLLGVTVLGEDVDLRDDIVGQLIGELLDGDRLTIEHLAILGLQFLHGCGSRTRCCLIGGNMYLLDMADILDALQYHNHHDSGAVWIGNDSLGTNQCVLGIALGHYEGYVGVHAECRTVVNHHGSILRNVGGKLLRCATTC